jgi:tellurite resistance protein TerC
MRAIMIFIGAELVRRFEWILVIFGLFLVLTAVKMAVVKSEPDPSKNPIVRLVKKYMRLTEFYDGQKFFTKRTLPVEYTEVDGKKVALPAPPGTLSKAYAATPLLLALVLVEVTDLIFAVDSIPAIFAVTKDPFLVFTSNVFAIMGLRSLYFALASLMDRFGNLKFSLAFAKGGEGFACAFVGRFGIHQMF